MRFGVCTWVWASPLRDADVLPIAERARGLGDVLATAGLAFLRESVA